MHNSWQTSFYFSFFFSLPCAATCITRWWYDQRREFTQDKATKLMKLQCVHFDWFAAFRFSFAKVINADDSKHIINSHFTWFKYNRIESFMKKYSNRFDFYTAHFIFCFLCCYSTNCNSDTVSFSFSSFEFCRLYELLQVKSAITVQ